MGVHARASSAFETSFGPTGPNDEKVYANGSLQSTRRPVTESASQTDRTSLANAFPAYSDWITKYNMNLIGQSGAYRQPYTNTTYSLYVFESCPSDLMTTYNVSTDLDLCDWFGFKFTPATSEVQLKVPYYDESATTPTFPFTPLHYANIYSTSALYGKVDAYFQEGGVSTVTDFCNTHSLTLPWTSDAVTKEFGLWSVTYDRTTLVPELVKTYVFD